MTTNLRDACLFALTEDDLERGKGSVRQQRAWQELEWRRCAASSVYFLSRYGHIILKDGTISRWNLWPIQVQLLTEWEQGVSTAAVKARQLGVTTLSAHFALWQVIFREAARWHLVSATEEKAKDIIGRIQATKDRLPGWMLARAQRRNAVVAGFVKRADRADAMSRISFGLSEMKILTSTSKSIQGMSGNFILDEFTEHAEQRRKLHMLLPAMDGGGLGIIIANGKGEDEFFWLYHKAKKGENRFKAHFFSWKDDPTRDEAWYEAMKRDFLGRNPESDEYAFKAQFPSNENEAFYVSGNSRFRLSVLNDLIERERERREAEGLPDVGMLEAECGSFVLHKHMYGKWRVKERPIPGAKYVMAADTSGGTQSGDYAVLMVSRLVEKPQLSLVQAAIYQAKVEETELAMEAVKAYKWYNEPYVIPEVNFGTLFLKVIKDEGCCNIYMRHSKVAKFVDPNTDYLGFWSDRSTKPRVVGQLAEWLNSGWFDIFDTPTLTELSHYEIRETKSGNPETGPPKGLNDDLVTACYLSVEAAVDLATFKTTSEYRVLMPWEA